MWAPRINVQAVVKILKVIMNAIEQAEKRGIALYFSLGADFFALLFILLGNSQIGACQIFKKSSASMDP